jgi:hypothetical protein
MLNRMLITDLVPLVITGEYFQKGDDAIKK